MASLRSPAALSITTRYVSWLAPPDKRSADTRPRKPGMRRSSTRPSAASNSPTPRVLFFLDTLRRALLHEAEQVARDAAHLDLLGALGDAIAPVMPVDVLERPVARVAEPPVHLHRAVGRVAAESIRPVVAHRDLV